MIKTYFTIGWWMLTLDVIFTLILSLIIKWDMLTNGGKDALKEILKTCVMKIVYNFLLWPIGIINSINLLIKIIKDKEFE